MPPTNPFSNYSDDQIKAINAQAYAPSSTMEGGDEDWFNVNTNAYGGNWDTMYDTIATKWLDAAGQKIVNADARKAFGRNLAAQKGLGVVRNLAGGGKPAGATEKSVDTLNRSGDFFRTGNVTYGLGGDTLGKIAANGNGGDAAFKAYANSTPAIDAMEKYLPGLYGGPSASLLKGTLGDARTALFNDPHKYNNNPFFGTIGADPFTNQLANPGTQGLTGMPNTYQPDPLNPANPANPTPPVNPINNPYQPALNPPLSPHDALPGNPTREPGSDVGDLQRQQWQQRRDMFEQTNGYAWEPWQDKYWQQQAEALGPEAAMAKMQNNSLTRARHYARAMGQSDIPPRIHGPDDIAGMNAFYDFLAIDPQNRQELGDRDNWLRNMQRNVASGTPAPGPGVLPRGAA